MAATVLLAGMLLPLDTVLRAKQQMGEAADAAALAGADAVVGIIPGIPCAEAGRVAEANGASVGGCVVDGEVVTVRAGRTVFGLRVSSTATAGPP